MRGILPILQQVCVWLFQEWSQVDYSLLHMNEYLLTLSALAGPSNPDGKSVDFDFLAGWYENVAFAVDYTGLHYIGTGRVNDLS